MITLARPSIQPRHEIERLDSVCRSGEQITAHFNRTLAERVRVAKEAEYVRACQEESQ